MSERIEPGHYRVGRIETSDNKRPHKTGSFGVIKGETANQKRDREWSHLCEGALYKSKWFAYRIGPKRDSGAVMSSPDLETELLKRFSTRDEAVNHLEKHYSFDDTFER